MEEEIGIRVTRSRRRLSVEKSNDANSPVGTPTNKKNTKIGLKPHLDNIGENEVVGSPKRTTRHSIAPEPEEAVLTPSKRTTRVRSNTSLASVVESPRALRITRRNSLLAESEVANKVTTIAKVSRRISQDFNSILKDDNGNIPKPSTRSSEQNIPLPQTSTIVENEIDDLVSNINEVEMDRIAGQIFKISPKKTEDVNSDAGGLTNIDRFAVSLFDINMETDTDKQTDIDAPSTTPTTPIRKSLRLKSKRDSKSQEELSSEVIINETNEKACENTDRQNNSIECSDTVNTIKNVSENVLPSQNKSPRRRSCSNNISFENNKSGFTDDNSKKVVSTNNSPAKEFDNISPSNKENESLISADKDNVSRKSMLDEREHVSSNDSIIRRTPTSSKISSNASVLASDVSRKSRNSFEKSNSVNISSESLKLRTSPEKKKEKEMIYSYIIEVQVTEENADHQNSKNKSDCPTFLHKRSSIENKDAEEPMDVDVDDVGNGNVSLNENEIKSTSAVVKSNDNINDIEKLSHQQSTRIFSTIIMDDEKENEFARFSTENKKKPCNTVEELQEIFKSRFGKSIPKPNAETVDDANISNIAVEELQEISKSRFEKSVPKPNAETVDDANIANIIVKEFQEISKSHFEKSVSNPNAETVDGANIANIIVEEFQEISKSRFEKSVSYPNAEAVDDANISNIVAGNKAKKKKVSESKKDLNKSKSPNATEKNNEKTTDDVACSEVEYNTSEKLQDLSTGKSIKKEACSKSFSKDLVDNSDVKSKLCKSLHDVSLLTPKRTIKSPKLGCVASSTPKVNNSREIKIPKKVISTPTNNKSVQLQSSNDDSAGPVNILLDNKAIDAGDDYESGDSLGTDEKDEMEQNEIREKGETLNSDDESTGVSEYEKGSFLASSDKVDESLLSGTGDDLDISDNELNQSANSKKKYNIRMSKERKRASREMYEARHGITNNKMSQRNRSSRKIVTDSSDSSDSEIIMKKSANESKMRLYSSCDISKSETEKEISNAQLINETIIDDSHVKDPLSCTLPFKKRSLSNSSNQAKEDGEDSSTVLRHNESQEGEIEQVEIDENKSVYLNGGKSIDPLSNTICDDDDDLSSLSSVDANVVDNYNSVLSLLNQSNKSCVGESSSDESDKTNPNSSLTVTPNTPSSGENEDKIGDKSSLVTPIINSSSINRNYKNASNLSLNTCDSAKLNKNKKDSANKKKSANKNCKDLIELTIEDSVKEGKASEKLKSREMSILKHDLSTPDVDMHDSNETSMSSNSKHNLCSEEFNTTEGDNIEMKSKKKRKKSFSNSSIELQKIINDTNNEETSEINFSNEVLKKSKDEMKTESSLEDGKEKLSKKTKNKLKNQSLNFNEVSNGSVIENESIIENQNLTVSKKGEKKRSSIINLTDIASVCESTKTSQINSDCVIEEKKRKNNNDNKKTNLGAADTASVAEEDTKKSVKKKKKKDKLGNQSLNIVENSNDESFSSNASVIDNLNLTIIKKKKRKNPTERKSKDEEIFDKSVRILSDIENIDSKADNDKEMNATKNTGEFNSDTKLKKAKKKKSKNKSLNKDDSVDVSQASIDGNLNFKLPNTKTDIKKNSEHKNDSFYGETNKGKDHSVLVSAQTIKMCDSNSDDSNVRLLFSSDEEMESVSTKVKDILSCTAMREDQLSEEDGECFPLKKAEAKTNLTANGEGSFGDGAQICGSTNCEKVNKKRKRNRNKKKKADPAKLEVANVTKKEKGICTEEPSMNDHSPEEKSSKQRRRIKRKHVLDSETAEQNEGALKPQIQEAFLKNKVCTEQVVHEPEPKAKKRKLKEEPMAEYKKTKLTTTPEEKSTEIRRLPQTFLDQLGQSSKITSNTSQVTELTSTSKFKVDRANKRKAKPSEYLEQSVLIGTEPTWTSNTGTIRTVKKPKLLPSIPTVSASGEGFTTQFKVVPLVGGMKKKDARMCSERVIRNFKTDTLYGKKIKRITSEQLVRKQSNPHLW